MERDGSLTTDVLDDSVVDIDRRSKFLGSTDLLQYHHSTSQDIPEMQLRLLPNRICGYAMRNRRWLALRVDLVNDVADFLSDKAPFRTRYEDLILPRGHKKLLQALVTYYIRDKEISPPFQDSSQFTMDIVHGKGEGLIILLHGPPGVGKTSTAECVAAQLKRPLLPITCGDLGDHPKELERNLDNFCTLAHKWRCVLLLDEADVFLSKREKGDLDRNAIVGGENSMNFVFVHY
jgi:SpoVK/Ycf46/Vps4 family AAA+-type ATPase